MPSAKKTVGAAFDGLRCEFKWRTFEFLFQFLLFKPGCIIVLFIRINSTLSIRRSIDQHFQTKERYLMVDSRFPQFDAHFLCKGNSVGKQLSKNCQSVDCLCNPDVSPRDSF